MTDPSRRPTFAIDRALTRPRPMRVAVVTETWPPEVNGVATTLARIVEGLQQRHHELHLVRPRQPEDRADALPTGLHQVLTRGLPIPRYPHLRMGAPSKRQLLHQWGRQRPDVVHVATEGPLGWSAVQAATQLELPLTSDFRTNFHAYSQHYGIGWLHKPILGYLRSFHNRCALTMVPTETLQQELMQVGFRHVHALARGVDTHGFSPVWRSLALRARWGVGPDDLVVACVGRLAPEKNLQLLEQSFAAIAQRLPTARLLLVGDGPMRAELKARLPNAILAGQRRGEDLAAHYASADLFLFPSLTETFGNVTTEAMASALPVVAFDCAGAAQLIRNGVNGRLAPFGQTASFVQAAVELAMNPQARRSQAAAARQSALLQDWGDIVARFETLLRSATRGEAMLDPGALPVASTG